MLVSPTVVAERFRAEIKREVRTLGKPLQVVGLLAGDYGPSHTYAAYTKDACEELGIAYDLRQVPQPELEQAIAAANADPAVHGIMVYYPIYGDQRDLRLKDMVDHRKDIEGLSSFWLEKLYNNERIVKGENGSGKAVVPCTALSIIKILEANGAYGSSSGLAAAGKTVTIFNRSEVVGRPLAVMMSNDGARVYSFDINGVLLFEGGQELATDIDRARALKESDMVITGVPSRAFDKIRYDEIAPHAICLNFATIKNFAPDVEERAELFIPRVGPVTVAMCMRNTLRLYRTYRTD